LCTRCYKNLWIVCSCVPGVTIISGLSVLVYEVLQESLDCLFLCTRCYKNLWIVCSCVPGVTIISGLSILVYQVLQESLDCLFLCTRCYNNLWIVCSCVPGVTRISGLHLVHKNRQSRDSCNTWYTRIDNPDILVTPGTQEQTIQRFL
jgi:hypothetical protein